MSLITRCPACETMFKVVPDQLRISDGWVRCGQCSEVFDASQHLLADPAADVKAPGDSDVEPSHDTATPAASPVTAVTAETALAPAPRAQDQIEPPKATQHDPNRDSEPAPSILPSEPAWMEAAAAEPAPANEAPTVPQGNWPAAPSPLVQAPEPDEDTPEVSFMRDSQKKSVLRRPIVRIILLLLVLLLMAALAAQILLHERDRIVSIEPSTRPLMLALCAWSQCELAPVRQIESIVIASSSFNRIRGDNYRLGFSLKNNAALDLAMPAIELALTDSQDQAVVRRVILPAEFGAASNLLAAGSDWNGSLSLGVKATADRIAGYRLLAFYP